MISLALHILAFAVCAAALAAALWLAFLAVMFAGSAFVWALAAPFIGAHALGCTVAAWLRARRAPPLR